MYYVLAHFAGGILLLLVFEYTGRMAARILSLPVERTSLPATLHFLLGCAAWTTALIALGCLGLLHPGLIRALVWGMALFAGIDLARRFRSAELRPSRLFAAARWSGLGVIGFIALTVVALRLPFYYLLTLSPRISWDADNYHLTIPRLFLEHGGFRHIPFSLYGTWPLNTEMLYALAMSFQDYVLAKSVHFGFGVILLLAIFETARRLGSPVAGLVALFLFMAERLVRFELPIAYVDLATGLFFFVGYLVWQGANFGERLTRGVELRLLFITGICAGFFAGSKLTGAILIVIFVAMQLSVDVFRRRDLGTLVSNIVVLCLPALVLAAPWYVKSWLLVGDPLHPGLYSIFQGGGAEWSSELAAGAFEYHASRGMGREPIDFLLLPARLIGMLDLGATGGFGALEARGGGFKTWWAVIAPFLVWGAIRLPSVRHLLAPALIYFVYWSQSSQIARLLLPVLPFMCCAAGISISEAVGRVASRLEGTNQARRSARVLRMLPALFVLLAALGSWQNHPLLSRAQLERWAKQYSAPQSEIFDRSIESHFKFINEELPEDARLMMVNYSRGYFCQREYIADSLFASSQMAYLLKDATNTVELQQIFEAHGITHLLYSNVKEAPSYPRAFHDAMKNEDGLELVFLEGRNSIYQVVPLRPLEAELP